MIAYIIEWTIKEFRGFGVTLFVDIGMDHCPVVRDIG